MTQTNNDTHHDELQVQEYVEPEVFEQLIRYVKNGNREEFRDIFLRLHDYDQAQLFEILYPENKRKISQILTPDEFADLFEYMNVDNQKEALEYLPDSYLAEVFSELADDDVVDLLQGFKPEEQEDILDRMHLEDRIDIEAILSHAPETAGSIMTTELIRVHESDTADEVIQQMRQIGRQSETIYYIYVVNEHDQLTGVVSLRDVLLSPGNEVIRNVMNTQPEFVETNVDQEEVAKVIQDYDLLAIPVVNQSRQLVGIVTVDDVMDIIQDEMEEDFRKFSGISGDDDDSADKSILNMTKQRVPWIIILILLGLGSASLISAYEETLAQVVALASFMPIILDSAGNVGTQSLAVSVRRITLAEESDEPFIKLVLREFLSGILMGLASAVTIGIIAFVMYQNIILSFIVGVSLLITLSIATVVGCVVPTLFNAIGIDPAVASGPFITTICDGFALIMYFNLATNLLHLLS